MGKPTYQLVQEFYHQQYVSLPECTTSCQTCHLLITPNWTHLMSQVGADDSLHMWSLSFMLRRWIQNRLFIPLLTGFYTSLVVISSFSRVSWKIIDVNIYINIIYIVYCNHLLPWKLPYPLKIDGWKMTFPFNMVPFQGTCWFLVGEVNHHVQLKSLDMWIVIAIQNILRTCYHLFTNVFRYLNADATYKTTWSI